MVDVLARLLLEARERLALPLKSTEAAVFAARDVAKSLGDELAIEWLNLELDGYARGGRPGALADYFSKDEAGQRLRMVVKGYRLQQGKFYLQSGPEVAEMPLPWFFIDPVRDLVSLACGPHPPDWRPAFRLPRQYVTFETVGQLLDQLSIDELPVIFPADTLGRVLAGLREAIQTYLRDRSKERR